MAAEMSPQQAPSGRTMPAETQIQPHLYQRIEQLAEAEQRLRAVVDNAVDGIVRDISDRKKAELTYKFLADASSTLAELVDYESTLKEVAQLAVPNFADLCMVYLVDRAGTLRRVAVAHVNPEQVLAAGLVDQPYALCPDARHGPTDVLRTGRSKLVPDVTDAHLPELAENEEQLPFLRSMGIRSWMVVPLSMRGRVSGVMTFSSTQSGRRYEAADLSLAEDLAHRAAVAIENARLYAEVKDADRRKDEFLAMLAHELRNPLAPIRSGLDLLEMEGVDAPIAAWARDMMKHQVQHLVWLVDDLLDVSRIMLGKVQIRKERLPLKEVINRDLETAQPLIASQGHQLVLEMPEEPIWIEVDPMRIAQVIANLLNNAAKYNNKPGHIWVTAQQKDGQAVLQIRDDGIGIERELLPYVFDLFRQANRSIGRSQGSLGIGLTLVRSLVELHGGTVEAHSEGVDKGSQFIVRLPAIASLTDEASLASHGPAPQWPSHMPHRRVLIVDDNTAVAKVLLEIISRWDHEVCIAHTGEAALKMAKTHHPHVVFLDIGLPDITGYQVAEQLRRQPEFSHTLLVAVTGYGQAEDRRRSRKAGFNHHLVKPVTPEILQDLLASPLVAS
ncbi:MAG: ATP-binding protein [Thermoguttaceae bacterium]